MPINLQPLLQNELIKLIPLKKSDFKMLYKVASDPLIWEQHPNKNRYQKEVFKTFFEGAIKSNGAFLVFNTKAEQLIGSSRYYDFDKENSSIAIGYTFLSRDHWGTIYNNALKTLMLNYAFEFVIKVIFHIGAENMRSQKAIAKLGAIKTDEIEMEYFGEEKKLNFIYEIEKSNWN